MLLYGERPHMNQEYGIGRVVVLQPDQVVQDLLTQKAGRLPEPKGRNE